jgi:hypothetical protein
VLMGFAGLWSGPWVRCNLILAACFPSLSLSQPRPRHSHFFVPYVLLLFPTRCQSHRSTQATHPSPACQMSSRRCAVRNNSGTPADTRALRCQSVRERIDHSPMDRSPKVVLVEEMSTKDAGGRNSMSPRSAAVHFNDQALVAMIT